MSLEDTPARQPDTGAAQPLPVTPVGGSPWSRR